jgi:hypothetical protein
MHNPWSAACGGGFPSPTFRALRAGVGFLFVDIGVDIDVYVDVAEEVRLFGVWFNSLS